MTTIHYLKMRLTLLESGGVSAPAEPIESSDERAGIQVPLDRDDQDRVFLPETTIAGALRAHLLDRHGADYTHRLLGTGPAEGSNSNAPAIASRLSILASVAVPGVDVETRTTTAIDRHRGAARASTLRSNEFASAGTSFEIFCSWIDPDPHDWQTLIDTLADWTPLVGHAVGTGHGRSRITALSTGALDLRDDNDLHTYLTRHGPDLVDTVVEALDVPSPEQPDAAPDGYHLPCVIDQAVHIGTGQYSSTKPHRALFFTVDGVPTIPGSSLKGLFRSRIEYILRSVDARPVPCSDQACQQCLPCRVFGFGSHRDRSERRTGSRSRLRVLDSSIAGSLTRRVHAPIDRFTGGVANQTLSNEQTWAAIEPAGQLHTEDVVESGSFTVKIHHLDTAPEDRLLVDALLRLVVEDINDGLISLGRGRTRGHGRITVDPTGLPTLQDAQRALRTHVTEGDAGAH
ncbi:RAMP superfamily CRISPR-associated protein [Nocardia nova]